MIQRQRWDRPESSQSSSKDGATRPGPVPAGVIRHFTRGHEKPQGVVWFGARSFWGHLRHLIASAIATESVDSRDWMTPDEPQALVARIATVLAGNSSAPTLLETLDRDLYVDYVADTGDDVSVSRAVARLVFAAYELPDPDNPGSYLRAPRGDILLFGGDTAYPVATAQELTNRIIVPWNQVLRELPDDGRRRVLLGVAGNHDWYDGLDGFGRMFRRKSPGTIPRPVVTPISQKRVEHHTRWAREFVRGHKVEKPKVLALSGYITVQNASYFALPLAPGIELLAVDRQLTTTDSRQAEFLRDYYQDRPESAAFVLLPDPVYHFGDPSKTGVPMVESLHLDLEGRESFILTGDIHHYERSQRGKLLHVIAGGGGAFLHPARIAKGGLAPTIVWPDAAQSRTLLRQVPWKLAIGRSGFLPHYGLLGVFFLAYICSHQLYAHTGLVASTSVLTVLLIAGIYALIGGAAKKPSVLPIALGVALLTVMLPIGGMLLLNTMLEQFGWSAPTVMLGLATLALDVFAGALIFGAYLSLLTLLGYENMQAFTALDHPGFKHFVRLRVRADGRGIDGWCIGAADPLGVRSEPVLVDHFSWKPRD
jgi:hypothetical protein